MAYIKIWRRHCCIICSAHFEESAYETQSIIGESVGINIKKMLRKDAIPTVFLKNYTLPSTRKKVKKKCMAVAESVIATSSTPSLEPVSKQPRNAFRKREAGRIIAEYEQSSKIMETLPHPNDILMTEEVSPSVSTQTIRIPRITKNSKTQTRVNNSSKGVQCKTQTKDQGVQCSLLQDVVTSTPCQSEDDCQSEDEGTSDEEEEEEDSSFGIDSEYDDQGDECTYE